MSNLTPEKLAELRRLYDAAVVPKLIVEFGLCGCMTKTPDIKLHHPDCPYVRMERFQKDLAVIHNALPDLLDAATPKPAPLPGGDVREFVFKLRLSINGIAGIIAEHALHKVEAHITAQATALAERDKRIGELKDTLRRERCDARSMIKTMEQFDAKIIARAERAEARAKEQHNPALRLGRSLGKQGMVMDALGLTTEDQELLDTLRVNTPGMTEEQARRMFEGIGLGSTTEPEVAS